MPRDLLAVLDTRCSRRPGGSLEPTMAQRLPGNHFCPLFHQRHAPRRTPCRIRNTRRHRPDWPGPGQHWQRQGHELWVWSRPAPVQRLCNGAAACGTRKKLGAALADAVVNLAGAPIADRPWTRPPRRDLLWRSRVELTRQLVDWMGQQPATRVLLSASAIGWYGDQGVPLTRNQPPGGKDFGSTHDMAQNQRPSVPAPTACAWYGCALPPCWP